MFDIKSLDYLYRVYQFRSIRLAAESIPTSSSTVSSAIHKLEKKWGVKLLERTYRGIELTEFACKVAVAAEPLFEDAKKIQQMILNERQKETEQADLERIDLTLQIYLSRGWWQSSLDFCFPYLAERGIKAVFPDAKYDYEKNLRQVNDNPAAVVINYFLEPVQIDSEHYPNVRYEKLSSPKPCIIVSKKNTLIPESMHSISPKDVIKLPIVRFTEGFDQSYDVIEMLARYGEPNIVSNVSNLQVLMAMIENLEVVSIGYVVDAPQKSDFRYIPINGSIRHSLLLCYNQNLPKDYLPVLRDMAKQVIHA